MGSFWHLLFDHIEDNRRFERLRRYIEGMSYAKLLEISATAEMTPQERRSLRTWL